MINLFYVHGSENHFYILDQTLLDKTLDDQELVNLTKQITSQSSNLNPADGLLVINQSNHEDALAQMRVINADGSEASMCGNGLRCVARYLSSKYHKDSFKVETMSADLLVNKHGELANNVPAFSVEISPVRFDNKSFPFDNLNTTNILNKALPEINDHLRFTAIAVPNPHLISFVENDHDLNETLGEIGKKLNDPNPYFTDGVNVNFAKILSRNNLFVHTYERGVGFTNACGTGMSATSLAFAINFPNLVDIKEPINVYNPGGMVQTKVHDTPNKQWIELIGNATFVGKLSVNESNLHSANISNENSEFIDSSEEKYYQKFVESIK
ncbi:diaminopimelate epimerase [Apilactobacillus apisilvae]|uniref:Diaminopimelate epimerase n=1 Tax=Apilactobacillus apisilvae TaxID=2923364 RepID=A0ABY4PF51_9LACO|nr:diaminopimelate epimerase [Apilactobacillus apisilvae]UQS84438.1 diaminopimelate epimerase [Apilactobacillus apisilvae]